MLGGALMAFTMFGANTFEEACHKGSWVESETLVT